MKLQYALLSNAAFSATSAGFIALNPQLLSIEIQLLPIYWQVIALGLGGFAVQLLMMAGVLITQSSWVRLVLKLTPSVIIADIAWVLGSLALALIFNDLISGLGFALIIAINVCVGSLALLQYLGLKKDPAVKNTAG